MKRILCMAALVLLVASPAWAGDDHAKGDMDAMMKEMANCNVCKNMLEYLPQLAPVMSGEVVTLSNGMAVVHTVSDPGKVELLQKAGKQMGMACAEAAKMSDADAEGKLCTLCSDVRMAMKAGATMGAGPLKNGDMFVLTSDDPKVQAKIAKVEKKFAMAMASSGHEHK